MMHQLCENLYYNDDSGELSDYPSKEYMMSKRLDETLRNHLLLQGKDRIIIDLLVKAKGEDVKKQLLIKRAGFSDDHALQVYIKKFREKIYDKFGYDPILTTYGVGYSISYLYPVNVYTGIQIPEEVIKALSDYATAEDEESKLGEPVQAENRPKKTPVQNEEAEPLNDGGAAETLVQEELTEQPTEQTAEEPEEQPEEKPKETTSQKKKLRPKKRKSRPARPTNKKNKLRRTIIISLVILLVLALLTPMFSLNTKMNRVIKAVEKTNAEIELEEPADLMKQVEEDIARLKLEIAQRDEYEKDAKDGNAEAQYKLALMCLKSGELETAETWLKASSDQGHATAKAYLGLLYSQYINWAEHVDDTKAFRLVKEAADLDDPLGLFLKGTFCHYGVGTDIDYKEAKGAYEKAITAGEDGALNNLGLLYVGCQVDGVPTEESYTLALDYFRQAFEAGFIEGKHNIAHMYMRGLGVDQNMKKAMQLFEEAGNDLYIPSMRALAMIYLTGSGGIKKNPDKAVNWLERGASLDDAECQYILGMLYMSQGYFKDLSRDKKYYLGVQYIEKAADAGIPQAQYLMGVFYYEGKIVALDTGKAYRYLLAASQNGGEIGEMATEYFFNIMEEGFKLDDETIIRFTSPPPLPVLKA